MMQHVTRVLPLLLLLAVSLPVRPADAATWTEFGDAGPSLVTSNTTVGNGFLTEIQGTFLSTFDIDMYCFRIVDRASFSASRLCASISEPDLYLFDSNGNGVSLWDGCSAGIVQVSGLFVPTNGIYYLAIAASDQDARNAVNQLIWNSPSVSAERAPDGPGAPGPLNNWAGSNPGPVPANYTINLTGAAFCDSPVPVEKRTWSGVKIWQ